MGSKFSSFKAYSLWTGSDSAIATREKALLAAWERRIAWGVSDRNRSTWIQEIESGSVKTSQAWQWRPTSGRTTRDQQSRHGSMGDQATTTSGQAATQFHAGSSKESEDYQKEHRFGRWDTWLMGRQPEKSQERPSQTVIVSETLTTVNAITNSHCYLIWWQKKRESITISCAFN